MRPLVEERDGVQTLNIYGPGGRIIAQVVQDGRRVRQRISACPYCRAVSIRRWRYRYFVKEGFSKSRFGPKGFN